MAISYVGAGAMEIAFGAISPDYPAGIAADDLLLGILANGSGASVATPTGWTQVPLAVGSTLPLPSSATPRVTLHLWYRVADGSEGATASFGGTGFQSAMLFAWRGVDPAAPFDADTVTLQSPPATTHNPPGVTTAMASALAVTVLTARVDAGSNVVWTQPAGWTERADHAGANNTRVGLAELEVASPGLADPGVWTIAGTWEAAAATFALKAEGAGGGGGSAGRSQVVWVG